MIQIPMENVVAFPAPVKVKNPAAVALGKLGGSKGGRIRAANLSDERKKEIAQQAAKARWAKVKVGSGMVGSQPPSKA
jgi:hypothetical protein